jgi:hypothetical protein
MDENLVKTKLKRFKYRFGELTRGIETGPRKFLIKNRKKSADQIIHLAFSFHHMYYSYFVILCNGGFQIQSARKKNYLQNEQNFKKEAKRFYDVVS